MNYSSFKFALDLQEIQSQVSIPVTFGDTARKLHITLTDGGVPFALKEGCKAVLSGKKADGNSLYNDCMLDLINSAIIYEFTEQTASCEGVVRCELMIFSPEGKVMGSPRFVILVDKRVNNDDSLVSESEKTALDTIIIRGEEIAKAEADREEAEQGRVEAEARREAAFTDMYSKLTLSPEDEGKFVIVGADGRFVAEEVVDGGDEVYGEV